MKLKQARDYLAGHDDIKVRRAAERLALVESDMQVIIDSISARLQTMNRIVVTRAMITTSESRILTKLKGGKITRATAKRELGIDRRALEALLATEDL